MRAHRKRSQRRLGLVMALALAVTVVLTGLLLATPAGAAEVTHTAIVPVTLTGPVTGVVVPGDKGPLRFQGSQVQAETANDVASGIPKILGKAEPGPDGRFSISVEPTTMGVVFTESCDSSSCTLVRAEVIIGLRFIPKPDLPDSSGVHYATLNEPSPFGPCKLVFDPSNPSNLIYPLVCDPSPPYTLRPTSRFGNIEGTVTDAAGQPVARALVSAFPVNPTCDVFGCFPGSFTATNPTGFYRFPLWVPDLPMFGFNLWVPPGAPKDYDLFVEVLDADFQTIARLGPERVTVRGGEITTAHFVVGGSTDRAKETALGRPGCSGDPRYRGQPCNVTTGNMYYEPQVPDLGYPSAFGPLAFSRSYNSQSTYTGPLGLGWTHPFTFELTELPSGAIRVRNGAGNVRFYELVPGSSDTYRVAAPARDTSTLVKHAGGFTETERDGLRREFDPQGRLQAITTRAGWRTNLTYTADGLATVTDPGGRTLTFTYTGGLLTRVEGPGGLFAAYSYDAQNRLMAVTDALGTRWTYTYTDTSPSRLASVRDANGNLVEEHTYDNDGRVIATTAAEGVKALTLEYVDTSHTKVTDSLGRVTTYTFGNFGDQLLITQISGPCPCGTPDTTFEYDAQGRRIAQTDARGNTTRLEYDPDGNLITVTDALNQVTTWTYNAFGQVLTTTDPTGATTSFEYDATTGVLLQLTDALGHLTKLTPEAHNLPGAVTDPRGHTITFAYGAAGLLASTTDPTGATTTFTYDPASRLLQTTDALGGKTLYSYDPRSRLLSVTDPVGAVTQFRYDPAGNRLGLTDPNGRTTAYAYDAANRLIQVTDPAGGKTSYSYDAENNLLTVIDARGNTTNFAYNGHNRLTQRTDPLGASETFTYDGNGNLLTRTDRKGQTLTYSYDALNRLTTKTLPDGSNVTYSYDPPGRLLSATDPNGTLAFTYDPLGRLLTATSQDGRTLTSSYDSAGNRVGLQDETGSLTNYTYDARNLLTTLTDPRAGTFTFDHDRLGRRRSLTRPNGTTTTYAYDLASQLAGLTHTGPRGPFEALTYSHDPIGNRTADTRGTTSHQYAYDALDQLTAVQRQGRPGQLQPEETYSYDPFGNRLTGPHAQAYQYDAANRLTRDSTHAYSWDANGNLIQKVRVKDGRITTYTYDAEDRLIRVITPRTEVTFTYDPFGRRTEKRVIRWEDEDGDGEPDPDEEGSPRMTRYLYDQEDILATFNDTGQEKARYTHGPGIDEPLAEVRPHRIRFYHADVLGSIVALSGEHGRLLRQYRYTAFGIPEDHRGDPQPYRYTGREWDKEIGLYYYRARYYSPSNGRFLAEDLVGTSRSASKYIYVGNDPLNQIDPLGLIGIGKPLHRGFILALERMKDVSVKRTIRTLEKQIAKHEAALRDQAQLQALKHHEHELRVLMEQLQLARSEAARRGLFAAGVAAVGLSDIIKTILNELGELLDPFSLVRGELDTEESYLRNLRSGCDRL